MCCKKQIVSASQAGDIQFLDIRKAGEAYLTIDAHRGSLTALAVHRHAPVIVSGSAKQLVKVFSLQGEQLSIIRYYPTFMAQRIGSVTCLSFHPYRYLMLLRVSVLIVRSHGKWYKWWLLIFAIGMVFCKNFHVDHHSVFSCWSICLVCKYCLLVPFSECSLLKSYAKLHVRRAPCLIHRRGRGMRWQGWDGIGSYRIFNSLVLSLEVS